MCWLGGGIIVGYVNPSYYRRTVTATYDAGEWGDTSSECLDPDSNNLGNILEDIVGLGCAEVGWDIQSICPFTCGVSS